MTYPTNDVNFQLQIDLKHEAGHNLKIRYDWMVAQGEDFENKETETPAFKEWTLIQIEGEEPQPIVDTSLLEKISPAKKGAPPAKGAKAVEEVIDNRPRTVQFKRDFAEEQNG